MFTLSSKKRMTTPPCFSLMMIIFVLSRPRAGQGSSREEERERTGACWCDGGGDCRAVVRGAFDFQTAEDACREKDGGRLMTVRSTESANIVAGLLEGTASAAAAEGGDFWIGLRLPDGRCSDLSAPLRGYQWTAGGPGGGADDARTSPSVIRWRDNVQVCAPRCVSLSKDNTWTERPCRDRVSGSMCEKLRESSCRQSQTPRAEAQALLLSDPGFFFKSAERAPCSGAPCEHTCAPVPGGYKCSCFPGYAPRGDDAHLCAVHCPRKRCPAVCDPHAHDSCFCPEGYIKSEDFCEDIDECAMQKQCDHACNNTLGGYFCACREGFILEKDGVNCARLDLVVVVTPGFNDTTREVTQLATRGSFLWIVALVAVALVLLALVVWYGLTKRQEDSAAHTHRHSQLQCTEQEDNIEC